MVILRTLFTGLLFAGLVLQGCGDPPSERSPSAGVKLLDASTGAAEGTDPAAAARINAGLEALLGHPPDGLRGHVDPQVGRERIFEDENDSFGRVFYLPAGLASLLPVRDGRDLPGGLDEIWRGVALDDRVRPAQTYIVYFAGTPGPELKLLKKRVVITGLFVGEWEEWSDKKGREHRAPVLVTREIRPLRIE